MSETIDAKGQCLCGAITFEARGAELEIHACHCSMCRRWCGGGPAFATRVESVEFQGEEHLAIYDSSAWAMRGYCRECGTNLFYLLKPDTHIMNIGGFEDPNVFVLDGEIFHDDRCSVYALAGDHPRHAQLP